MAEGFFGVSYKNGVVSRLGVEKSISIKVYPELFVEIEVRLWYNIKAAQGWGLR